jgi:hypothetical protein
MESAFYSNQKLANWKEYFQLKFLNNPSFKVDVIEEDIIEGYRITSAYDTSQTEILFKIFSDNGQYQELFDVHFNNPDSPDLASENSKNTSGFDGQGSTFNQKNLNDLDDWITIPINKGWIERTTYLDNKKIKTDCVWVQNGDEVIIPIKSHYLDGYGCLMIPIVPIKIY